MKIIIFVYYQYHILYTFIVKYIYVDCCSYVFKCFFFYSHSPKLVILNWNIIKVWFIKKKYFPFFTVFSGVWYYYFFYYCSLLCRFRPNSSSVLGFALGTIVPCLSTSCHVFGRLLIHYSSFHGADLKSYFKTFCTDGSVKWALKSSMESPKVMQFGFTNKYH